MTFAHDKNKSKGHFLTFDQAVMMQSKHKVHTHGNLK